MRIYFSYSFYHVTIKMKFSRFKKQLNNLLTDMY